ncbi:MAG: hypothetical protein R2882_15255 [Gemmatimonadales bacterium]
MSCFRCRISIPGLRRSGRRSPTISSDSPGWGWPVFRIDAAKHIQQVELDQILGLVNTTLVGEGRPIPYVYLEVNGGAGEALSERDFFGEGYASGGAADVTEFTFVGVGNKSWKLWAASMSRSSTRAVRPAASSPPRRGV